MKVDIISTSRKQGEQAKGWTMECDEEKILSKVALEAVCMNEF